MGEKNKRHKGWRRKSTAENTARILLGSSVKCLSFAFVTLFYSTATTWKSFRGKFTKAEGREYSVGIICFEIISLIVIIIFFLLLIVMLFISQLRIVPEKCSVLHSRLPVIGYCRVVCGHCSVLFQYSYAWFPHTYLHILDGEDKWRQISNLRPLTRDSGEISFYCPWLLFN